jgi:hypothetical protein
MLTLGLGFGAADSLLLPALESTSQAFSLGRKQNGSFKDVHILIPRTCEYVTLHKKEF